MDKVSVSMVIRWYRLFREIFFSHLIRPWIENLFFFFFLNQLSFGFFFHFWLNVHCEQIEMKSNHLQSLALGVISRHYQSLNSDKRLSPFDGDCTCNKDTLDIEDATHAVIGFMAVKHKGAFLLSSCIHLRRMTLLFQYLLLFPSMFSSSFFVLFFFLSVVFSYSPLLLLRLCAQESVYATAPTWIVHEVCAQEEASRCGLFLICL